MAEQRFCKPLVVGSIPTIGSMKSVKKFFKLLSFAIGLYLAFAFAFIPIYLFGRLEDFVQYAQWEWRQREKEGV